MNQDSYHDAYPLSKVTGNTRNQKGPKAPHNRKAGAERFKKRLAHQYGRREIRRSITQTWIPEHNRKVNSGLYTPVPVLDTALAIARADRLRRGPQGRSRKITWQLEDTMSIALRNAGLDAS